MSDWKLRPLSGRFSTNCRSTIVPNRRRRVHARRLRGHDDRRVDAGHLQEQPHVVTSPTFRTMSGILHGDETVAFGRSAGIGRAAESEMTNVPYNPARVDRCRPVPS
jgi:hypothetical protein